MSENMIYAGFHQDSHGITTLGRIVLDAWLFELINRSEDCAGWDLPRMQMLMQKVNEQWDEYGNIPSRLPPELREKPAELYAWATARAHERGWDPELDDED